MSKIAHLSLIWLVLNSRSGRRSRLIGYLWAFLETRTMRWIAALIGYFFLRLPGALLGFLLGSMLEGGAARGPSSGGPRPVFGDFGQRPVSPADFELKLLSLCSIVIKADGQATQRELDYVFSSHCLEHLERIFDALSHWYDCLRDDGFLFLYLPHPDMRYWNVGHCPKHLHTLWPVDVYRMFERLDLVNIQIGERDLAYSYAIVGQK